MIDFFFSGLTVREAAEEVIENARRYLELEMGVENIVWSKSSKQTQIQSSQRKRKLDDGESSSSDYLMRTGQGFGKKFRPSQSESESESDTDSDSGPLTDGFTLVRINSAESNMNADDESELIEKLNNEINLINVFEKLEFFKRFEATVKNSSVVSVSVGVNQLLQRAAIIGLRSLVKQMCREDEDIGNYNCTFDDDKFIAVISFCLGDTIVYYMNIQNETSDDVAITFNMKIKFLVDLFHMTQMTVVMYDAKEQCKVLLKCIPQLRTFCVQLRDPLVANWLLQPDVYGNLLTMVSVAYGLYIHVNRLHLSRIQTF